jgi:DNA-binding CsgD family transcriptional regulator
LRSCIDFAHASAGQDTRTPRGAGDKPLLSPRESEPLRCLAAGQSSQPIAEALGMSVRTGETHRQNIRRNLNLGGQAELIKYAVERCADPGSGVAPPSA